MIQGRYSVDFASPPPWNASNTSWSSSISVQGLILWMVFVQISACTCNIHAEYFECPTNIDFLMWVLPYSVMAKLPIHVHVHVLIDIIYMQYWYLYHTCACDQCVMHSSCLLTCYMCMYLSHNYLVPLCLGGWAVWLFGFLPFWLTWPTFNWGRSGWFDYGWEWFS